MSLLDRAAVYGLGAGVGGLGGLTAQEASRQANAGWGLTDILNLPRQLTVEGLGGLIGNEAAAQSGDWTDIFRGGAPTEEGDSMLLSALGGLGNAVLDPVQLGFMGLGALGAGRLAYGGGARAATAAETQAARLQNVLNTTRTGASGPLKPLLSGLPSEDELKLMTVPPTHLMQQPPQATQLLESPLNLPAALRERRGLPGTYLPGGAPYQPSDNPLLQAILDETVDLGAPGFGAASPTMLNMGAPVEQMMPRSNPLLEALGMFHGPEMEASLSQLRGNQMILKPGIRAMMR